MLGEKLAGKPCVRWSTLKLLGTFSKHLFENVNSSPPPYPGLSPCPPQPPPLPPTACPGRNRVSHGFCHRSMAKHIYHGKTHDIWVLPCNGFSHSSMAKPMDIMKRNIHGFCHGPLLHGFCHGAFRRKLPLCFQSAWIFFLHCI